MTSQPQAEQEVSDPKSPTESVNEKIQLQDQTNLLPLKHLLVVFVGLSCALFCSLLDQTLVSTALPTIGRAFHDAPIASWVGTAYLLSSTACQPLYGRLSDIFGRKNILMGSILIFLVGSIICAVSTSMIMLIVFRAIAGIGGGGIITLVMIVVSDVVSLEKRGTYQGIIGVVVALANSMGPLVGGVFTEKLTWRWCFYINIPLSTIALVVAAFALPLKPVKANKKLQFKQIDYLGCITMLVSAVAILLPISWGGTQYAWSSAAVITPLVLGIVFLGVFIFVEIQMALLPIIPMHIFKIPTVAGALTISFFSGFMFYANLYYLPQYFQVVLSASPIKSGVLLLPLVVIQCIVSFVSGFIVSKTGNYTFSLRVGFIIWAIACGLLSTLSPKTPIAKLVGYQILSGVGSGQTFQTALIAIQAGVKRDEMAVATATRNFIRMLGGTVALAACAAILNNSVQTELVSIISRSDLESIISDPTQISSTSLGLTVSQKSAAIQAYTHGFRNIYYFMVACCFISFVLSVYPVRGQSLKREDDAKRQEEGKEWVANNKRIIGLKGKSNSESSPMKIEEGLGERLEIRAQRTLK